MRLIDRIRLARGLHWRNSPARELARIFGQVLVGVAFIVAVIALGKLAIWLRAEYQHAQHAEAQAKSRYAALDAQYTECLRGHMVGKVGGKAIVCRGIEVVW